ncbi:MAG TPA: DNA-deoxyinosine glycosylase [Candidatus Avelusimicrobium excrementipullorum]|nr:DNA-deoxyinosine glycosylase [Candidatus Avelusimicrobium excrementipullorum]
MLKSFPPVAGPQTRLLIIGSMPGEASLRAGEYYAYKYNQFWRIIFDVFENGRTPENYQDKRQVILKHGLGLWDTLAACRREGSLDSRITQQIPNDFPALFARYPAIHTLLFNGTAAFAFYKRAFGTPDKKFYRLPSTSPAHASRSYAEKLALWRAALEHK